MRRTSLLLVGIAGLTLVGQAFADDAGIWQFLLGQGHGGYSAPPAPAWPAMPPPMLAPPRAAPHVMRKPVVHLRVKRPQAVAHAEMPQKGPVSIYNDRTLRRGDSVMTAQGLRVFKGSSHFPYRAADFVPLAEASKFVMGDKKQLRDIQLAFERIDVPATQFAALVTGRSVSTGKPTKMMEAAGKQIRYVGP
ncbi:MAG TPA: hypothetical protein VHR44_17960 [Beijerinckiaceae bacterium]|jgi:hypothetical protein|nr:hypothetical protein [Beijerinckiaceae bacterium]